MRRVRSQTFRTAPGACGIVAGLLIIVSVAIDAGAPDPVPGVSQGPRRVIHTYDARPLQRLDLKDPGQAARIWDTMHLLAALQGLVNRAAPRLYLFYCADFGVDTDAFWFDWLRGEDGWLKDAEVRALAGWDDALGQFRSEFEGLVVYDAKVPATANAASTAAGCERLLPVRFDPGADSLFSRLTQKLQVPVKLWLVNRDGSAKFTGRGRLPDSTEPSRGSAKVDVHRWAMKRYLHSDACAPAFAAYYLDAFWPQRPHQGPPDLHTLSNHDYFIPGDSGAGYLNVRALTVRSDSRLPSGLAAWQAHCRRWYERWDLTITGFVLDGAAGAATDLEFAAYRPFSPDGIGTHFEPGPALRAGLPTCPEKDLPDSVEDAARFIAGQATTSAGRTGFLWARSILKPPQWYADLSRRLREEHAGLAIEVVDPYTFFGLVRLHLTAPRN